MKMQKGNNQKQVETQNEEEAKMNEVFNEEFKVRSMLSFLAWRLYRNKDSKISQRGKDLGNVLSEFGFFLSYSFFYRNVRLSETSFLPNLLVDEPEMREELRKLAWASIPKEKKGKKEIHVWDCEKMPVRGDGKLVEGKKYAFIFEDKGNVALLHIWEKN